MKQLYAILLFSILPGFAFCQQEISTVLDSTFNYRWDPEINDWKLHSYGYVNLYDSSGNHTKSILYDRDEDAKSWIKTDVDVYAYDSSGNLVEHIWLNRVVCDSYPCGPEKFRQTWSYDENGNLTGEGHYFWDSQNNDWVRQYRWRSKYDENGNETEFIQYGVNNETSEWAAGSRIIMEFDTTGNRIEKIKYRWNRETNLWTEEERSLYTYDSNGNRIETIEYRWDGETHVWLEEELSRYTYDTNGNRIELMKYEWDPENSEWVEDRLSLYRHDDGILFELFRYDWDSDTIGWKPGEENIRFEKTYDTSANLTEDKIFIRDPKTDDWELYFHTKTINDATDNQKQYIRYGWDFDSGAWVGYDKDVSTYDPNWNLIEKIVYAWDLDSGTWVRNDRHVYTYDENGKLNEEINYEWDRLTTDWVPEESDARFVKIYDVDGNLTDSTKYWWDSESDTWKISRKYIWSYDVFGNITKEILHEGELWEKKVTTWSYNLILDREFHVDENCTDCTDLGSVISGSQFPRENITFSTSRGNTKNILALDSLTGNISLNKSTELDYETNQSYEFLVGAQFKDSLGTITDQAVISILVNNINDNAPVVNDTTFNTYENSDTGMVVGTLHATDEDGDLNPLTYSILEGNIDSAFSIGSPQGIIDVSHKILDYETRPTYTLEVKVSDGTYSDTAFVVINLTNDPEDDPSFINNRAISNKIRFYPNPAGDQLTIVSNLPYTLTIEISSLSGQVLHCTETDGQSYLLDLSSLRKGIYIISVRSKDSIKTEKLIKL